MVGVDGGGSGNVCLCGVGALQWEGRRRDSPRWHSHPRQHERLHQGSQERDLCSPPGTNTGRLSALLCCRRHRDKWRKMTVCVSHSFYFYCVLVYNPCYK